MLYLQALRSYFGDEAKKASRPFDPEEWDLVPGSTNTPQQNNFSDCGVFTCITANYLARVLFSPSLPRSLASLRLIVRVLGPCVS